MKATDSLFKRFRELKRENNELRADKERFEALCDLIWRTRRISEHEDYQQIVGLVAEIRSGNYESIDAARKAGAK